MNAVLLEKKTKGMPSAKKEFIFNLLNDKSSSYIQENFSYVVEMFERGEEEKSSDLVQEAKNKALSRDAKIPATPSVITESVSNTEEYNPVSNYLNELSRY